MGTVEDRGAVEAVNHECARGRQADQQLEALAYLGQLARCGQRADARAAEDHAAAQEAMPGGVAVEPQEVLAQVEGPGLGEAEADVVAQCADVGHVVVEALQFEQRGAQDAGVLCDSELPGVLEGQAVSQGMADGGVPRDALGQGQSLVGVLSLEVSFDAFVDEPQARLHAQDGLPRHPEAEVPRFDEAGVDRADRDLVDAGPLDGDEGERPPIGGERRHRPGVVAHRMPALGPVLVQDQAARLGVSHGDDAEEVGELALEAARRKRERRQGRHSGRCPIERHVELHAAVRWPGDEEIDGAQLSAVVVTRDQGETHAVGEQCLRDVE